MSNKKLIIVFAVLLGLYLLSRVFLSKKESTFDPQIVSVDTAAVTEIRLFPKAEDGAQITLKETADGWIATKGEKTVKTPYSKINGVLSQLISIQSERIVSKSKDRWPEYEVGDQGSRVEVYADGKKAADFVVGTFKFDQAARSASSYMRRSSEDDVHLVDGFISMSFNQGFDAFRNSELIKLNLEDVLQVTHMAGDERIAIQKNPEDGLWYRGGMELLDSARVAQYIGQITNVFGAEFVESPPSGSPLRSMEVNANNLVSPLTVDCYATGDTINPFILHSSSNPDTWFASDSAGLYQRLFRKFDELLVTE